jgi:hypothetical protein
MTVRVQVPVLVYYLVYYRYRYRCSTVLYYFPRHNVDEKVELVVLCDGHGNVVPLQCPPLVVLQQSIF